MVESDWQATSPWEVSRGWKVSSSSVRTTSLLFTLGISPAVRKPRILIMVGNSSPVTLAEVCIQKLLTATFISVRAVSFMV